MAKQDIFLSDIVAHTAAQANMTKVDVEKVLRHAFEFMGDKVSHDHKVFVTGFMNFEAKDYKEKAGKTVNPTTQEPMKIPAYRTVMAKPTKALKRKCVQGHEADHK